MCSKITPKDIKKEVEKHTKAAIDSNANKQKVSHNKLLNVLLEKVEEFDFRKEVGSKETLKKKHFIVITVEKILALAMEQNWGLCKRHDFIYLYNGAYWSQLEENELLVFLGKAAQKMGVDRFDSKYYRFRDDLLKQFMSLAYLPAPELPDDLVLINLMNGTVEIQPEKKDTISLREPRRSDFLTYQLSFCYNPTAEAPKFQQYLDRVLPDRSLQDILAEYIGYVFVQSSALKLEKTLLLYGSGGNGKSVFFDVVNALLGSNNVTNFSLSSLTDKSGYYRAKLGNALLNYSSEIDGKMDTALFKQMVSGEPVEARLPYGDPFTLTNYAKLVFNCNELPAEVENTDAFFRRFLIIPFNESIPKKEQDKELSKKIIEGELSGVFNWVLDGLKRLLKQKNFTESTTVEQQVKEYRQESDSVLSFIDEYDYEVDYTNYIPLQDLFEKYVRYCENNGRYSCSSRKFSKRLKSAKIKIERKAMGNVVYLVQNK